MSNPTLFNLPPPPSDPVTPSDIPGTPNSGATSLSTLSTIAIKDGHQGHAHHHTHHHSSSASSTSSTNTLDAERADRISRLAGLERVATARQGSGGSSSNPQYTQQTPAGYFDNAPSLAKERSTVGSASATGSVGGKTWADGSDVYDTDKMSEDQDDGISSAGLSDEGTTGSLVGFGEGAGSTVSGPISTSSRLAGAVGRTGSGIESPSAARPGYVPGSPMQGVQGGNANQTGQETAERIVRERLHQSRNKA